MDTLTSLSLSLERERRLGLRAWKRWRESELETGPLIRPRASEFVKQPQFSFGRDDRFGDALYLPHKPQVRANATPGAVYDIPETLGVESPAYSFPRETETGAEQRRRALQPGPGATIRRALLSQGCFFSLSSNFAFLSRTVIILGDFFSPVKKRSRWSPQSSRRAQMLQKRRDTFDTNLTRAHAQAPTICGWSTARRRCSRRARASVVVIVGGVRGRRVRAAPRRVRAAWTPC